MSEFTKGPWESIYNKTGDCFDVENDGGILVAEVYGADDALVMAASKDLLEALESALVYLELYGETARFAAEKARAAIAKARGM